MMLGSSGTFFDENVTILLQFCLAPCFCHASGNLHITRMVLKVRDDCADELASSHRALASLFGFMSSSYDGYILNTRLAFT